MAVTTTHSITSSTMEKHLPFAAGVVASGSEGLSTEQLDDWISEAAGQLNGLLQRHGIDPELIGGDTLAIVQSGIRAYVRARALNDRRFPAEQIQREWETWQSVRKTLREDPQSLGDDQASAKQVVSNINVASPTTTRFDPDRELF